MHRRPSPKLPLPSPKLLLPSPKLLLPSPKRLLRHATSALSRRRWKSCSQSRTPTSRASSTAMSSRGPSSGSTRTRSSSTSARRAKASSAIASSTVAMPRHSRKLAIGDTVLVYVLQPESPEGHVRPVPAPRRPRAQVALDAGAVRDGRHHRGAGHRPQQGRPDRRLRHPRLRSDQPDRGLPAPPAERPAARRGPGDRREAACRSSAASFG